ncbi:hypothetical protein ACTWQF_10330 [Streptomyces sp. 8N114]|uniref:hypothetical protein n=1 Tax=Streptomyces sp. 8N114 TaxID=3457419 RepID=UPI003FD6BBB0
MLPDLVNKGFLNEAEEDRYRLSPAVRHLSGLRRPDPVVGRTGERTQPAPHPESPFDSQAWAQWKKEASPALRRHVEVVEQCAVCALPEERVARAFMEPPRVSHPDKKTKAQYGSWKAEHPDRGLLAARYTVAFRAEHGHGPSYNQLCTGLGWNVSPALRGFVVQRLLANEWLTDTAPVPWTLRPGRSAQLQGISLPTQAHPTSRQSTARA